ncbi:hypothetical protein JCM10908_002534 [Rhodotorula pacifica]|uniref:iron-sulfur cluster assembly protein NAR1 n=1 Tax=Rhodotorula pacifica TaxID=1495444 RepID=UPI003174AD6C
MSLSSGLTLADLSDYLAPSQACIKPVTYVPDEKAEVAGELDKPAAAAAAEIIIGEDSTFYERGADGERGKKLKKAEITLNDCLACSGCITSAESVLVSLQSHEEVYRVLQEQPELVPIASISPQSVASLAALYDLSLDETMRGLRRFFRQTLGFRLVFDTTFPRALSLLESRAELHERRSHYYSSPVPSLPSILTASTSALVAPTKLDPASSSIAPLPVLSSACPGWICYAEKTHGDLLPFVSGVKSPQAVAGVLVKGNVVAGRLGLRPDQIYHVAIMPCYDKKLEASRPDFATSHPAPSTSTSTEPISVRDVDLVLTTGEVAKMLSEKGLSLRDLAAPSSEETEAGGVDGAEEATFFPFSQLLDPPVGTSSGSYVQAALSTAMDTPSTSSPLSPRAPAITSDDWPYLRLSSKLVRNDDYVEFTLRRVSKAYNPASNADQPEDEGVVIARAAKCYGFRNLQNVVRKISREAGIVTARGAAGKAPAASSAAAAANARRAAKKAGGSGSGTVTPLSSEEGPPIEFIEVMACPSGCVNGGGQVPPPKESLRTRRRRPSWSRESSFVGRADEEGMPDTAGEIVEAEIKLVADEGGDDDERVLSAKEWVQEVERRYWSGAKGERAEESPIAVVHPSVRPFVQSLPTDSQRQQLEAVLAAMLDGSDGVEASQRRKELLRTSYRSVETEEINGLAVTW